MTNFHSSTWPATSLLLSVSIKHFCAAFQWASSTTGWHDSLHATYAVLLKRLPSFCNEKSVIRAGINACQNAKWEPQKKPLKLPCQVSLAGETRPWQVMNFIRWKCLVLAELELFSRRLLLSAWSSSSFASALMNLGFKEICYNSMHILDAQPFLRGEACGPKSLHSRLTLICLLPVHPSDPEKWTNEQTAVHSDSVHINRSLISLAAPSIASPLYIRPMQKLAKLSRCIFRPGRCKSFLAESRIGRGMHCQKWKTWSQLTGLLGVCEFAIFPQDC